MNEAAPEVPVPAAPNARADVGRSAQRREARARRRGLPPAERRAAALAIARHLAATGWLRPGRRIAAYLATAEEIDPVVCLALARRRGCELWLPRLDAARQGRMSFAPARGPLRRNVYGIAEPANRERLSSRWMQVVLLPLVAFDAEGTRLGMGGGFYDRALSWRRLRRHWRGPRLVGVAHSTQQLPRIVAGAHDVRLDAVITERGLVRFD